MASSYLLPMQHNRKARPMNMMTPHTQISIIISGGITATQ
jgi:hypothetical protein